MNDREKLIQLLIERIESASDWVPDTQPGAYPVMIYLVGELTGIASAIRAVST